MRLNELARLAGAELIGLGDIEITSIEHDSRLVTPGTLFVAVPGFTVDGHSYIARALENGAQAFAVQADHEALWRPLIEAGGADVLVMPDTRSGMAKLAAAFHGYPARKLKVVGVTGTDGKTSLCHLIAHVLNSTGHKAGLISTAECRIGDEPLPDTGRFTTPESPAVQSMLAQMVDAGCEWAVIEATSHGLALHRVDECEYDIAVLTNIGRDHIDFHGSHEDYVAAKGRLFQMLDDATFHKPQTKVKVLNARDPYSEEFFGLSDGGDFFYSADFSEAQERQYSIYFGASDVRLHRLSTKFHAHTPTGDTEIHVGKPGAFNVDNALAALAVSYAAGISLKNAAKAIESWPGAPGRMEIVDGGQPFRVVVDFAHAPDSLRRVLTHLRESSTGRIIAVFGCIGERDKDRRSGMAAVAAELADYTIVTDDNPYSENRMAIIEAIAEGLRAAGKKEGHDFAVVPDRREAISQALSMAVDEDAVLLAGKGHERTVHLGGEVYECHDPTVASEVLRSIAAGHR